MCWGVYLWPHIYLLPLGLIIGLDQRPEDYLARGRNRETSRLSDVNQIEGNSNWQQGVAGVLSSERCALAWERVTVSRAPFRALILAMRWLSSACC